MIELQDATLRDVKNPRGDKVAFRLDGRSSGRSYKHVLATALDDADGEAVRSSFVQAMIEAGVTCAVGSTSVDEDAAPELPDHESARPRQRRRAVSPLALLPQLGSNLFTTRLRQSQGN